MTVKELYYKIHQLLIENSNIGLTDSLCVLFIHDNNIYYSPEYDADRVQCYFQVNQRRSDFRNIDLIKLLKFLMENHVRDARGISIDISGIGSFDIKSVNFNSNGDLCLYTKEFDNISFDISFNRYKVAMHIEADKIIDKCIKNENEELATTLKYLTKEFIDKVENLRIEYKIKNAKEIANTLGIEGVYEDEEEY